MVEKKMHLNVALASGVLASFFLFWKKHLFKKINSLS